MSLFPSRNSPPAAVLRTLPISAGFSNVSSTAPQTNSPGKQRALPEEGEGRGETKERKDFPEEGNVRRKKGGGGGQVFPTFFSSPAFSQRLFPLSREGEERGGGGFSCLNSFCSSPLERSGRMGKKREAQDARCRPQILQESPQFLKEFKLLKVFPGRGRFPEPGRVHPVPPRSVPEASDVHRIPRFRRDCASRFRA